MLITMYRWFALFLFCQVWNIHLRIHNILVSGADINADTLECISPCNLTKVTLCPEGSYFSSGICFECPAGQYCFGNVSAPRKCPPGTYNLHPGRSSVQDCQPCAPGLISTEDGVDCRLCPAGYSCDTATGALLPCQNGQYSPEGHTQCLPCPFGFVCKDGFQKKCGPGEEPDLNRTECAECPKGYYSTLCSAQCELCPAGSYCPHNGMSQPLPCPMGQYTDVAGQSSCKICNSSVACASMAKTELQPSQRNRMPVSCPPGTHRDGEGPGCAVCPLGHYCVGSVTMQCPAGTYGPKEGLQRERDCTICPAGFYCLEGTSRRPSSQFLCPQGYYCEEGTAVPHGSPCPAGTAGGQLGQTSRAACKRCAEGRYCPTGSAGPGLLCARGRYCPAGTVVEVVCPRGTFTPHQGALSVKDCLKCPAGFYCPEGTSDPLPCQPGTFNPLEGQDALTDCRLCYPGKACTQVALKAPDVDCMPGFVCPPGSARPNDPANACPPGTLSNRTDLTDRSQCQLCPARYACLRGTGGIQRPPLSCFAGHYCPVGTMFPTQHKCSAGTWNERSGLESESECRPCPRGWYCLAGVGVPSGRCSSGYYCPEGTMYGTQFPCPRGTYSIKMGNGGKEDCVVCPEGYYCQEGSSKPIPCPPTTFRQFKGGQRPEDCVVCPAGYYCPHSATVHPRVCGTGSYSDEGSEECLPCLPGHYCSDETTSEEAMLRVMVCPPGFLCSKGLDRDPQRSAVLCPIGFYCPGGGVNPNPIPCPNGTYSRKPGLRDPSDCTVCSVGMYCFSQQPQENPITEPTGGCPDGYYCPLGTGHPLSFPCESGFFRNESHGHGGGACVKCPARYYCASVATHTPLVCPEGFFCPEGSSAPEPCEEGTYSSRPGLREASECTLCDGGKYCTGIGKIKPSGNCEGGFYCRQQSISATPFDGPTGGLCPAGSFCSPGSAHPQPCPSGTFSNSTGLKHVQQCVKCPAGYYCLGLGATSPTGLCSAGYYCSGGSASPVQHQVEEGHYSVEGAVKPEPCPLGTFQPERGQSACIQCKPGRLCNLTGLSHQPLCPPGHYCTAGTSIAHPCPPGTYMANPGAEKVQYCGPCDAGQYCHAPGLSVPQGPCEPGFYCSGGANTATPVNFRSGDICPAGYYCPEGTRHPHQYPCPSGTWSSVVGAQNLSSCSPCPAGFFCNKTGLTQPTGVCAPGFFCISGAKRSSPEDGVTGNRCPAGYYCPQGCTSPQHCPDGTYSNTTGAAECSDCPPGWLCMEGEEAQLCPEGHYCLGGRVEDVLPCPPGTYNPKAGQRQVEQCSLCSAGMYCEEWGLVEPTGPCQSGYFCLAGINFRNPDANFSTGVGGACPPGHYCPEGTSQPLPCPLGTFSSSLYITESSGCSLCPPGQFCGSVGLSRPAGPCQKGFYCPAGATSSTGAGTEGGLCPQAHYCPLGSVMPLPCPAGTYSNLTGQTKCSPCHAGYYCPESTSNYTKFPCPPGFYCPDGTRHATQFPCPRGYYNPEPMTQSLDSCLPCLPGHYCEKERLNAVSGKCKAGWFCVSAAWNPQPFDLDNYTSANCLCPASSTGGRCQAGYFCPAGSSEPIPCPPGAFCNATALALPSGPCAGGYYCTGEATQSKPTDGITGDICPPGSYCAEGSREPEPCPVGTFSAIAGLKRLSQCQSCRAGHYCSTRGLRAPTAPCSQGYWCPPGQTDDLALPCPLGHQCPPGSSAPVPCPSGTYQDKQKQANCTVCEEGFYCEESFGVNNVSVLQPCPKGYYCPKGTRYATQFPCPAGSYNPKEGMDSLISCLLCPVGHFCPFVGLAEPAGLCMSGYWCREGSHSASPNAGSSGSLCPVGHYCPKGTTSPVPCPLGTLSNSTGLRSEDKCQPCPGGFYCASTALSVPTGLCSKGFYCTEKATTPMPTDGTSGNTCPQAHFCPNGTATPVPCDSGTFMTATQASQCWPCTAGWYCVDGARLPCPQGFYCPEGTAYEWRACPPGTYSSDSGLSELSQCRECDGGHYCSYQNAASVSGQCSAGYYCTRGNTSPQPLTLSRGDGGPCPAGHYCLDGTTDPQPCPVGTFNNRTKLISEDECVPCSPGHYCDTPGLTAPKGECWEGFYCSQGALLPNSLIRDVRGGPCPAGYFCPRGSSGPQSCPQGSISNSESQASCSLCPRGYYCLVYGSTTESRDCPEGHYCPTSTSLKYQYPCPAGTINPYIRMGSSDDCLQCTPGFFCKAPGQSAPFGPCAAGHFCLSGAVSPTPEDGETGDRCPPGHYCPVGSSFPLPCPHGHYSNSSKNTELSACLPCPAGFACSSWGLSAPSHACHAGYYCPRGQNSSHPAQYMCSPGYMCPPGSATQISCTPGSYQSLHTQAECLLCLPGFFCAGSVDPETGIMRGTTTPVPCPMGHYCPAGTKSGHEFPCPAGTYSNELGMSSVGQCIPCPSGLYCGSSGLSTPTGDCSPGYMCIQGASQSQPPGDATGRKCPAGFYCPAGTSHMHSCPPGTFSSLKGAASILECQSCPAGQYCADYGLSSPSGPCNPGYYCTLRSVSPTPHHNRSHEYKLHGPNVEDELFDLDQITGDFCPQGHYCPIGSAQPLKCPPGTFLGWYGAVSKSDCNPCVPGFFCPDWGQKSVELLCPEGWFCPAGSATGHEPGQQCPLGHSCPYGSTEPAICPPGTYQSQPAQPSCQTCPTGFYCLEGESSPMPCPAGTLSQVERLQSLLDCSPCPPGFYCNISALTTPSGPCSAGHFCLSGATEARPVSQTYGDICPAGFYCPEQSSAPLPCPVGHFLPDKWASSSTACSPCPPGMYCLALGSSQPSGFCSPGHYCTGGADTAIPKARAIQLTCFCDLLPESSHSEYYLCAQRYSTACTAHSTENGIRNCMSVNSRLSSESALTELNSESDLEVSQAVCNNFTGDICPIGFYCPAGSSLPQLCNAGFHCNQTGLHAPVGFCPAGFYCPKGSSDPYATPCPPGHYCPRGTALPLPCLPGTLRRSAGAVSIEDCLLCSSGYFCDQKGLTEPSGPCSEGYYCPVGQNSSRPPEHACRAGHYCEEGSISGRACPMGSYQPMQGQQRCEMCPVGFSCPQEGMTKPVPCKPGFYCPASSAIEKPCPAGTYGNQSGLTELSECTLCDPGTYCVGAGKISPTGQCMAGFLCFGGASLPSPVDNITGMQCPPGFYCLTGSFTATPCPKGTFSVQSGLTELGQCQSCSPGFYCSKAGLTAVSGPCLPGFYCSEGSPSAAPVSAVFGDVCPPGYYCESGSSVPTPCPVGTHLPESGGKGAEDCMPCPDGLFQDQNGQRECKPCPPGFHCPSSTQKSNVSSTPLICPEGYYCPNETLLGRPVPCPRGTYSNNQGLTSEDECMVCPVGYFCGAHALIQPSGLCAPGFLCFLRATVPNPTDNTTGALCPPGVYCQLGVRTGTDDCSPGYYCDWGSSSPEQRLCPAGFYCLAGTDKPIACGPGTFSSVMGNNDRENCEPCPAGYFCRGDGVVVPVACPQGFYCPPGTVMGTEFPCPRGTVQPLTGASTEGDCLPCPSGMFCVLPGLSEATGLCQEGYHCPSGAISPNATGYKMNSTGNNMCPPGHYCPAGTGYPLPCPPGTFSSTPGLSMVEKCQSCPPGYFCEKPAMANSSDALFCDAGYVCLGGSRSARPIDGLEGYICPSGYSCPIGTQVEIPCEPGTYSNAPGSAHCLICPSGTMCPTSAIQEPSPCPKGHFCPAGTSLPLPCPVGTLGQATRAQSETACLPCPPGLYCSIPGASQPQGQCEAGYFCQSGSAYPAPHNTSSIMRNGPCPLGHFCPSGTLTPLPCPAGTIRNLTGGYSIDSCLPCPAGHYCASDGLNAPSGPCSAGFYCPADVSSTTPHAFLCPKGHYCPLGSPVALPCPTGQYQPNLGSEICIPCRPGFYCEEVIAGDPSTCPSHSYCPEGTMVPQPCPNGTYTPPDVRGLQNERECLTCPPGKFCRSGQIRGLCAAGYVCISGSSDFTPQGPVTPNTSQCGWGVQCAGLCPAGYYCPEGTEKPQACPGNTLKETPGGSSIHDCLPCSPRHWCKEGDPEPYMCPEGHYCDGIIDYESEGRPGPRKCPQFTYRPTSGAGSKGDCLQCPAGTFCNATGLTDFSSFPCPPGYWCSGTGLPVFCQAGTFRTQPGANSSSQCQLCAAGTYCPDPRLTGRPNTVGIPCRASYQCPIGSVVEVLCRAGSYCRPQTGEPTPCPAGYYCPLGSHTYNTQQQICTYPFYCPDNSSIMLSCGGGFMPRNASGLRASQESSCMMCEAGTYRPSGSHHLRCLACPPGYHCHPGTDDHSHQPCPFGYFCPLGSASPVACPPGSFGNSTKAELLEECHPCPPGTFNHLYAQRACFPCGSSSISSQGASSCMCIGKNRAFQYSDGSCVCKAGYVFYNELDFKSSIADSDLDCQPEVSKRCGTGHVRLASSQDCVSPYKYSCSITCGPHGGSLDISLGICHCEMYVSAEELCNSSCMSALPVLSARLAPNGQLVLRIKAMDESRIWSRNMMNVLGPDSHISSFGKLHFVQFSPDGVFGWILKDPVLIDIFLSEPFEILDGHPRKRRHSHELGLPISGPLPRIPNPIACLSPNDMLIFQLTINYTDRLLSHFPVYQKNHLFSSNPAWDFGAFRQLERLVKHSQFNSTRFAHVFMEPGKYVFLDNAVADWSLIVVVKEEGTECDPTVAAFQPTSPAQLVRHGIVKQQRLNLLPDWGTIGGVLALMVLLIVVLTLSALLLRPNHANLIAKGTLKPKWRSLGEPTVPVAYVYNGDCMDNTLLGLRGVGEGAEEEEPAVCKGFKNMFMELEGFNVKTLYDKLEDQNLHLASQLAKHRKDTQEFYRNICQQTDKLRDVLENMEPSKLIQWKQMIDSNVHAKKQSVSVESSMGLMEAVLKSLEAVLFRLNGETWQQPQQHRESRESEIHTRNTQISSTDMSELKAGTDTEVASTGPVGRKSLSVPPSSTAPCVSEDDLAKLVALTPLTRTLQDIKHSLQELSYRSKEQDTSSPSAVLDHPAEWEPTQLIPVALDNLSPGSFAVFLFGCHVVQLLNRVCSFPPVMLLLAKALPVTCTDSLLAYCNKEFYYDTSNQILYILESKLHHAGQFISVLLHSMAYISSGSARQDFMGALHSAISALSMQLFQLSFTQEQQECMINEENPDIAFGTIVEDFFSAKVPPETHFSQTLLAERLQKYKYFKLEHFLHDQKLPPENRSAENPGQMSCKVVEQEQASILKCQQDTVEQRLKEMRDRLSKSSAAQRTVCQEESPSQTPEQTHSDSQSMSKHKIKPADNQGVVSEQFHSNKQHSKHMDEAAGEKDMMA